MVSRFPEGKLSSKSIPDIIQNSSPEKGESGEKITKKEKIETGQVKFSVLKEYFEACGLTLLILFVLIYSFSNVASLGSNFYLSKLSDNKTSFQNNSNYWIFASIGLVQCNY